MPATVLTPSYSAVTTHTMTLASLASDANLLAGRQDTPIDNTVELADDSMVGGKVTTGTSPTAAKQIEVWAYGSYDGTSYSAGAGNADANITLVTKTLMSLLQIIPTTSTSNQLYVWGPFSVARAFGGTMPKNWGIFIVHNTGVNLNATAGNHEVKHTPVKYQSQ
jgi:hypothetical protein